MSDTIFTCPGKSGDAIHQFAVAAQWARQTGKRADFWLDEKTCKPLVNLFQSQPFVDEVKLVGGVENWNCGGQPWHLGLKSSDFSGKTIYHLGLRGFPSRQLTLQCAEDCKLPVEIDRKALATEPAFVVEPMDGPRRLVLHGQPVCPHTKSTPAFWKFLGGISEELKTLFDEIVWVGDARDREIGTRTYPEWKGFDDHGDFLNTARLMRGSDLMIGCGSSMAALAQALKIPTIRVHDPIGENPKVIWSGLGANQLNATELELRKEWPLFRDSWVTPKVTV